MAYILKHIVFIIYLIILLLIYLIHQTFRLIFVFKFKSILSYYDKVEDGEFLSQIFVVFEDGGYKNIYEEIHTKDKNIIEQVKRLYESYSEWLKFDW